MSNIEVLIRALSEISFCLGCVSGIVVVALYAIYHSIRP